MIPAVFDCMIYLQAAGNRRGVAGACLQLIEEKEVEVFATPTILDEVRSVLFRPSIRRAFPKLTDENVTAFVDTIQGLIAIVDDGPSLSVSLRDPKDAPYLNLAVARRVSFLVSRDKDLLSLQGDAELVALCPSLTIIEPKSFLSIVRTGIAKRLGYE